MGNKKGNCWHKGVQLMEKLSAVPDDQLLTCNIKPLPMDHWCDGCGFATRMPDRIMCPFIEGSCIRIPGSIEKPCPEILHSRIRYDRIYTDTHKEVFDGIL